MTRRVLFVCLGNICRSAMAEGAFRAAAPGFDADSAGTAGWHAGKRPDPRAIAEAAHHGVDISEQRARQLDPTDFHRFDLILAMDDANLRDVRALAPANAKARIAKMLDHCGGGEVPDPYYGDDDAFARCWATLDSAARALAKNLGGVRGSP